MTRFNKVAAGIPPNGPGFGRIDMKKSVIAATPTGTSP